MHQSLLGFVILLSFMNGCASMLQKSTPPEPALKTQDVQPVFRSHISEIDACYHTTALKENRIGRVVMQFTVGKEGTVTQNAPKLDEVHSPALISCMVQKMASWRFPKPRTGLPMDVIYPFTFPLTKNAVVHSAPHPTRPAMSPPKS